VPQTSLDETIAAASRPPGAGQLEVLPWELEEAPFRDGLDRSRLEPEGIVAFEYPSEEVPEKAAPPEEPDEQEPAGEPDGPAPEDLEEKLKEQERKLRAEMDTRLRQEKEQALEAGRQRGLEEGRKAEREQQAAQTAQRQLQAEQERRQQAAELVESFERARDQYLHRVEEEVVALALAVAARILRREAQMDPLLLTGAVRVALNQLGATTKLRLRVPEADLEMWREAMALIPGLTVRPEMVGVAEMRLGDCEIQTELGSVDLGIRAQLAEIERGFFDRAGARRPAQIDATPSGEAGR
jgi:flagellar assembly protein FliH